MDNREYRRRQIVANLTPLDDIFMSALFNDDPEVTAAVLKIILDKPDLVVTDVKSQAFMDNLGYRSFRFDVKAVDHDGTVYDIEVQRGAKGATGERIRANTAILDSKFLGTGEKMENLPKSYVIFITETDVLKGSRPIYHIYRTIEEKEHERFVDGQDVIYVNCSFTGEYDEVNLRLMPLIHDFKCSKPEEMIIPEMARKAKHLKEDKKEVERMCETIHTYLQDELDKAVAEEVTKRVAEEVTKRVAEEVTKRVAEEVAKTKAAEAGFIHEKHLENAKKAISSGMLTVEEALELFDDISREELNG